MKNRDALLVQLCNMIFILCSQFLCNNWDGHGVLILNRFGLACPGLSKGRAGQAAL